MKAARLVGRRRPLELAQPLPLEQASGVLDAMDSFETLGFSVITGF
jgi:hypothetical protein